MQTDWEKKRRYMKFMDNRQWRVFGAKRYWNTEAAKIQFSLFYIELCTWLFLAFFSRRASRHFNFAFKRIGSHVAKAHYKRGGMKCRKKTLLNLWTLPVTGALSCLCLKLPVVWLDSIMTAVYTNVNYHTHNTVSEYGEIRSFFSRGG